MPETGSNIEIAHHMHEHGHGSTRGSAAALDRDRRGVPPGARRGGDRLERLPVGALGRARGEALRHRVAPPLPGERARDERRAGAGLRLDDAQLLARGEALRDEELARFYARRFLPDYRPAFRAWLGPTRSTTRARRAGRSTCRNTTTRRSSGPPCSTRRRPRPSTAGPRAAENGEDYVRATVLLATVLFLIALSQRFESRACAPRSSGWRWC